GLLTITGGKLTTFRESALLALATIRERIPGILPPARNAAPLDAVPPLAAEAAPVAPAQRQRLAGRYGADVPALVAAAHEGELRAIPDTPILWAELRWAARMESVQHLDDLLLRRARLGLLLPEGGAAHLAAIRAICQPELGWDDARWQAEEARYLALWRASYRVPDEAIEADAAARQLQAIGEAGLPGAAEGPRWAKVAVLVAAMAVGVAAIVVADVLVARRRSNPDT
ncbi:MAG TPA: glycerol-3-phosphate dehydrogenase C-terminal domain-containing protein, partial [Ktedonobacterales bacterium]|nr:glycerol-3-phosphate dehydrogenase C-terminal domain-containing protein [Ktedonobacterales bacterium]